MLRICVHIQSSNVVSFIEKTLSQSINVQAATSSWLSLLFKFNLNAPLYEVKLRSSCEGVQGSRPLVPLRISWCWHESFSRFAGSWRCLMRRFYHLAPKHDPEPYLRALSTSCLNVGLSWLKSIGFRVNPGRMAFNLSLEFAPISNQDTRLQLVSPPPPPSIFL